jgi:hypothetical protein
MISKSISVPCAVALTLATAAPAFARDSTWLLCKGIGTHGAGADAEKTYIVASLLEHRGAVDRDLGVTLIYGDHVTRGAIVGKANATFMDKAAALKLANVDGKRANAFTGTGMLAGDLTAFTLDGTLDFTFGDDAKAKPAPFKAKLTCEPLDDQAIGKP